MGIPKGVIKHGKTSAGVAVERAGIEAGIDAEIFKRRW